MLFIAIVLQELVLFRLVFNQELVERLLRVLEPEVAILIEAFDEFFTLGFDVVDVVANHRHVLLQLEVVP